MKWIKLMLGRRNKTPEGTRQAQELLEHLQEQAPEVRKLTHSLRTERQINHLGARIRLAMEAKYEP